MKLFMISLVSCWVMSAHAMDADDMWANEICATMETEESFGTCVPKMLASLRGVTASDKEEALRMSGRILSRCQADGAAFNECARSANTAKSEDGREFAYHIARAKMVMRTVEREGAAKRSALAACRKAGIAEGTVRIGMTADQVRVCGWGEPESVNRTTSRSGRSEQWVYGSGQYLYLDNGKLTVIQN